MSIAYPFIPKSSRKLQRGDFWSIPLSNGTFACGRVVELMPKGMPGGGTAFLGGLMNWNESEAPTSESIAGASFLVQGVMHVLAICNTGGKVLGNRPLELDGLDAFTFINGEIIQKGFLPVRKWQPEDNEALPRFQWWGYDVIENYANQEFLEK